VFFDGIAREDGGGAEVVLVSHEEAHSSLCECSLMALYERMVEEQKLFLSLMKKHILPYSFILVNLCFNNVVEYKALITGLQLTIRMGIKDLDVYGDS